MTNTGATCTGCGTLLTEQDIADHDGGDEFLCEDCFWKTQVGPDGYVSYEVTWKDGPESGRSGSFLDPADVLAQLDRLATSAVEYTREHQDEIWVVKTCGPVKLGKYTAEEFRAR